VHDLTHFSLADMLEVGSHVRACCNGAESLQAVAERIVSYLYRDLRDVRGARATAMVRFFLTRPFGALPLPYQEFVRSTYGDESAANDTVCLSLMATSGVEPDWNSPSTSRTDLAVPLRETSMLATAPMINALIAQFGVDAASVSRPDGQFLDTQDTFSVFHIAEARGSPYLPSQAEFVEEYDVRSVLG